MEKHDVEILDEYLKEIEEDRRVKVDRKSIDNNKWRLFYHLRELQGGIRIDYIRLNMTKRKLNNESRKN